MTLLCQRDASQPMSIDSPPNTIVPTMQAQMKTAAAPRMIAVIDRRNPLSVSDHHPELDSVLTRSRATEHR